MKIGLMFSGQGSQYPGMGKELFQKYDCVKQVYLESETLSQYPIRDISFNDKDERLNQTKYTQVCMFTFYQAILVLLDKYNISVSDSMGLSLGEYGAYLHQGVFDFKQGIFIVKTRGELMEEASRLKPGSMLAVIGINASELEQEIDHIDGYVRISNYNAHKQLVVSGSDLAVQQLAESLKNKGVRRVIPLKTSGAFHTQFMESASKAFETYLKDTDLNQPRGNLFLNTTGEKYVGQIKEHMSKQITHPVKFYQMVESMVKGGVDTFIEIGPKKTLRQLVRRINRDVTVLNIEDESSLKETLRYLEENQNGL